MQRIKWGFAASRAFTKSSSDSYNQNSRKEMELRIVSEEAKGKRRKENKEAGFHLEIIWDCVFVGDSLQCLKSHFLTDTIGFTRSFKDWLYNLRPTFPKYRDHILADRIPVFIQKRINIVHHLSINKRVRFCQRMKWTKERNWYLSSVVSYTEGVVGLLSNKEIFRNFSLPSLVEFGNQGWICGVRKGAFLIQQGKQTLVFLLISWGWVSARQLIFTKGEKKKQPLWIE